MIKSKNKMFVCAAILIPSLFVIASVAYADVEEFNDRETSAWGHYTSHYNLTGKEEPQSQQVAKKSWLIVTDTSLFSYSFNNWAE